MSGRLILGNKLVMPNVTSARLNSLGDLLLGCAGNGPGAVRRQPLCFVTNKSRYERLLWGGVLRRTPTGGYRRVPMRKEIHRPAHGGGAGDVPRSRSEVARRRREGAAGADSVAGRRGRAGVDGPANRGGPFLSEADGGEHPSALRIGRASRPLCSASVGRRCRWRSCSTASRKRK